MNTIFLYNPYNPKHYVSNFSLSSFFTILSSLSQEKKKKTKTTRERERMGACASKPNVLNGDAPEDALDKEELVNKEDIVIVDDADANLTPSNEEGKGSKEVTLVKGNEVEKVVDDQEKKIEHVKSQNLSMESEDEEKLPEEEAPATNTTIEEVKVAFEDNKIEDNVTVTEDLDSDAQKNKTDEKPIVVAENLNSDDQKNKADNKPVATKKGKFWWDK
uniref:Uncharacterized protein n=2 Tax=Solanum lycopersicum TaxID=4081 RepID=A0A3Q7JB71_SOLLC